MPHDAVHPFSAVQRTPDVVVQAVRDALPQFRPAGESRKGRRAAEGDERRVQRPKNQGRARSAKARSQPRTSAHRHQIAPNDEPLIPAFGEHRRAAVVHGMQSATAIQHDEPRVYGRAELGQPPRSDLDCTNAIGVVDEAGYPDHQYERSARPNRLAPFRSSGIHRSQVASGRRVRVLRSRTTSTWRERSCLGELISTQTASGAPLVWTSSCANFSCRGEGNSHVSG